jgi:protocatechuate 3,4-dioxygenase beta subunit
MKNNSSIEPLAGFQPVPLDGAGFTYRRDAASNYQRWRVAKEQLLRNHRVSRIAVAIAVFAVAAAAAGARNQNSQTELRTVHGVVLDGSQNPVASSIVYLLNTKTQAVRTYIADSAGQYRFSGLDPNVDYEIHAEHGDLTSSTRTISSFDSRRDIEMDLKLSHRKTGH